MATPVEIDYSNRDFESIRAFLVGVARATLPDWATVGEPSDFGTLLLELYAYMGDIMSYYTDRVAAEPFLATAVRRQSILGIADMLGYRPIAQQAANLQLTFTLAADAFLNDTVEIATGTLVQTSAQRAENAIYFETMGPYTPSPLVLGGSVRSGTAWATEGRTITEEYAGVSTGAPLQDYTLTNAGVIERTVSVLVNESDGSSVRWDFVDHLTDAGPDASVFTTYMDENLFMHVRFGDAVSGRIPPINSSIFVDYRYGAGVEGNVVVGAVTLLTQPIPGVTVTNNSAGVGGADPESIDSMRYSIPRASRTADRAVTLDDFAVLALQVPGVAKAVARGQYYTLVHVHIAPVGGNVAEPGFSTLKDQVEAYLTDRVMVGCTVSADDPQWLDVEVNMTVHVLPTYGQALVMSQVRQAITNTFAFTSVGFGTRISIGEVFRDAVEVVGVDYIELVTLRPKGGGTPSVRDIVPTEIQLPRLADADLVTIADGGLV